MNHRLIVLGDDRLQAARRLLAGLAAAGLLSVTLVSGVSADTAAAGNGGTSDADASGGAVGVGTVDDGDDTGDVVVDSTLFVDFLALGDIGSTAIDALLGTDDVADDDADDDGSADA